MMQMQHPFNEIYKEMKMRNYQYVINNDVFIDLELNNPNDDRKCLAILERYDYNNFNATENYYELQYDLHMLFKSQLNYHINNNSYKNGCLHQTLFQFIDFKHFSQNIDIEKYTQLFKYLSNLMFYITYCDISFTKTGICMLGYPSIDINKIRDEIRQIAQSNDTVIYEPYFQNTVHSTILRFSKEIKLNRDDIDYLTNKYKDCILGTGNISKLQIEVATWKANSLN